MVAKKPKKVWVCTSGEYSGYHIEQIFSTEELANDWAARQNRTRSWGDVSVEEWDVDAVTVVDRHAPLAWEVSYIYYDPKEWFHSNGWNAQAEAELTELPFDGVQTFHEEDYRNHMTYCWKTWVWADDRDAAMKIGADRIIPEAGDVLVNADAEEKRGIDRFVDVPERTDTPFLTAITPISIGEETGEDG